MPQTPSKAERANGRNHVLRSLDLVARVSKLEYLCIRQQRSGGSMLKENEVATTVVDVAYHIHRQLGPGLLESVYHAIMKYELEKRGLRVMSKEPVPIIWEDVELPLAFEADLIVEDVVVVELKSVEQEARVHKKQLLTYLRLTNCRLGLLINFGSEYISDGISRVVNGLPSDG